jgi:sugar transferase (PEP-CTERM system associated)
MLKVGGQKVPLLTVTMVATESALIGLSLLLATVIRFRNSGSAWARISEPETLVRLCVVVLICELTLYYHDLYDLQIVSRRAVLFVHLLQAVGSACLLLACLYFFAPKLSLGRGIMAMATPAILVVILSWRLLLDFSSSLIGYSERILVMGTGATGIALAKEIVSRPEFNLKVVGFLGEKKDRVGDLLADCSIIGELQQVVDIAKKEKVDRVILSLAERRGLMPVRDLLHLRFAGIRVEEAHTIFERISGRIMVEHLTPSWLILSEGFRRSQLITFTKRTIDILVSLFTLIITAPIMAIVALAIYLETGSPILFRQQRTGLHNKTFSMLKFRSMRVNSGAQPAWSGGENDPRITRVGRFIRKYRLDELPQMVNVLLGDMSIVGPRPEQPYFCELLAEKIPYYGLRHTVRPGITGWAQVKFRYGASVEDAKEKLEYDLFYVKHRSPFLDLAIIFETGKVLLSGRGAQ